MISEIIKYATEHMDKSVAVLSQEFSSVRTGRASAVVLNRITVDYYGVATPLTQIAGIKAPEPQLLVIEPWDKSMLGAIEKSIITSDLGLNPSNDGNVIRVPFPPLNEERRLELVKLCKSYAEKARVAIRNVRREANEKLKRLEKEGSISQDDLRRAEVEVQKATDMHISRVDEALKRKDEEIMEV